MNAPYVIRNLLFRMIYEDMFLFIQVNGHLYVVSGRGFIRYSALREHFRVHTGEKLYACGLCNR
jgi:hypothetical protein